MRRLASACLALILIAGVLTAAQCPARAESRLQENRPKGRTEEFLLNRPTNQPSDQKADEPVDHLGLSAIYSADIFQESLAVVGKPTLLTGDAAPGAVPSQAARDALTYKPSSEVERATRQKLLQSLLETTKTAKVQDEIRQSIKTDALWLQFYKVLKKAGFSTLNLADVTAAYYVITWQVVNSNQANASAAAIKAVRNAVSAGMLADARFAKMSDAEKQEAASVMAYMATVAADSVNQLHSTGDEDGLVHLREQVHDSIMAQGVDLDRLLLTDKGFITR